MSSHPAPIENVQAVYDGRSLADWVPIVIERLFERSDAERIILFGSLARGEVGTESDIDLVVVMPVVGRSHDAGVRLLANLRDLPVPVDIVVIDSAAFPTEARMPGLVRGDARRTGVRTCRMSFASARRWLRWAEEDVVAARTLLGADDVAPRIACSWAQQAAEKALKALLVDADIDPPKLHDLVRLARLTTTIAGRLDEERLADLTRWSVEGRYPADLQEASRSDARAAVDFAAEVVVLADQLLSADTR